jgi:phosphoglycolate phosphatase
MLFFDLDGPILDVAERYYRAYSQALSVLNFEPLEKKAYWNLKRLKADDSEILKSSSAQSVLKEFRTNKDGLIEEETLLTLDEVWPELLLCYATLFEREFSVLVTMRKHSERTEWQLKQLGIYEWFDRILLCPVEISIENRWEIKVNAINASGVLKSLKPDECIFVGDTETDISAGRHLGMKTIAVSFGIRNRNILLEYEPVELFDEPCELSEYLKGLT